MIPDGQSVSASAVPVAASGFAPAQTPRALTDSEIDEIITAFRETTRRAIEAGFDGVELHGAHGFLLQNFFSPAANQRDDAWGGSVENRMHFGLAVVAEVKRAVATHAKRPFILGYRISPEEPGENGYRISDSLAFVDRLIPAGIDYLHASLADVLNQRAMDDVDGAPVAAQVARHVAGRVPVIAAGSIVTPEQATKALGLGLSVVAVGRGLVMNPDWVQLAIAGRAADIQPALDPEALAELAIPAKLWAIIEMAKGWFPLQERSANAAE